ncbi:uncharacterized protein LOC124110312 [Haliotis rufescens]|uniref:uncharacterized protein LOC124110312 n=1 Tax=Haliotis rufescens TaxID=6454 RepID=UPI00201EDD49|nr:uncharacterized protein LOC124110312 [Haliotis rufescens]
MSEKQPLSKKQLKLRSGKVVPPLFPEEVPPHTNKRPVRYSSLDNFPDAISPTRSLGNARTWTSKSGTQSERDFLLLRKMIEMGEFQRPNEKLPFKNRRLKAQEKRIDTPPTPKPCQRQPVRSKSTSRRVPDRFNLGQIKRISIADFRRTKMPGFLSFVCQRKHAPVDLLEKTRSIHCDLFGPGLCPDCQKLENRYDFTQAQDDLFPYLKVTSRSLVAAPKLKNQPTPIYLQGKWHLSAKKEAGTKALGSVYTQLDLYHRMVRDKEGNKRWDLMTYG